MRKATSLTLLLAWLPVVAQLDTLVLPFSHLTIKEGLSQGMVNAITQDRYGFMWFGTKDGLNRYDGHHFKVYRHSVEDSTSLAENYVTAVHDAGGLPLLLPPGPADVDARTRGLAHVLRVLLNTNEFSYVD